jgi:hypothetical protein
MRLLRSAAAIALAKAVYDQARKPENQARIKAAVDSARRRRGTGRSARQR